jgi:hypothetical protein
MPEDLSNSTQTTSSNGIYPPEITTTQPTVGTWIIKTTAGTPSTEEPPRSFEQLWKDLDNWGEDIKSYAQQFHEEATKAKLPIELIEAVVGICHEIVGLDNYYTDTFATKDEDLKPLQRELANHQHLGNGKAALPL